MENDRFVKESKGRVAFISVYQDKVKVTDTVALSKIVDGIEQGRYKVECYVKDGEPVIMVRV